MADAKPAVRTRASRVTPEQVFHPVTKEPICGANRKQGKGPCMRPAGWGTDHAGFGRCKTHLGSTPALIKSAAKQEVEVVARQILGGQIDIDPHQALLFLIRRTAGMLAWLDQRIAEFEDDSEVWQDIGTTGEASFSVRKVESVWVKIHGDTMDRLARYSKMALDAGVNERQVALAEAQGQVLAGAIQEILQGLELTPEQQRNAPSVVRRILEGLPVNQADGYIETTGTLEGTYS